MVGWQMNDDWKGFRRKRSWHNRGTTWEISSRNGGKPRKPQSRESVSQLRFELSASGIRV
jgi:hypothetical protein